MTEYKTEAVSGGALDGYHRLGQRVVDAEARAEAAENLAKRDRELLFAFEAVLREMRTHSVGDRLIAKWVQSLDFERDIHARAALNTEKEGGE